jgi:hypothetical protein
MLHVWRIVPLEFPLNNEAVVSAVSADAQYVLFH